MRSELSAEIAKALAGPATRQQKARAAYLAICLDLAPEFKTQQPQLWKAAIDALSHYPNVLQVIFYEAPFPAGDRIRRNALTAGLAKPATSSSFGREQ